MKQNLGLLQIRTVVQMGLLLAGLGEAQTLQWVKPALASLPSDRCCGAMVFDPLMRASLLFGGGNGGIEPAVRYNDTWTFSSTGGWSQHVTPGSFRAFYGHNRQHGRSLRRRHWSVYLCERHMDLGRSHMDPAVPAGFATGLRV